MILLLKIEKLFIIFSKKYVRPLYLFRGDYGIGIHRNQIISCSVFLVAHAVDSTRGEVLRKNKLENIDLTKKEAHLRTKGGKRRGKVCWKSGVEFYLFDIQD